MITRWLPIWVIPLLVILAIGTVWLRLSIVRVTYDINQTEKLIANRTQEKERMAFKTAGLRSPRRLEALAKTKFNLTPPRSDQVMRLP